MVISRSVIWGGGMEDMMNPVNGGASVSPGTTSTSGPGFLQHLGMPLAHRNIQYLLQYLFPAHCHPVSAQLIGGFPLPVSYYVGTLGTHTEIKKVAEEKVTLPCHHQLGLPEKDTLDIEWLLTDHEGNQKVVSVCLTGVSPSFPLSSHALPYSCIFLTG